MVAVKSKKIRVVELFAGVGGFRLGFERCDKDIFKTIWANQWEPGQSGQWAYKCYETNFGIGSCNNCDIATVIDEVPEHDLLVGGFPCQDYSVAHSLKTSKGIEGKKGVLWWSINDIIEKRHPKYILLENVDRLLKSPAKQRGRDFTIILKCLFDQGYSVEWRVINAAEYGNVQRRRRIFIFACANTTKYYKQVTKESISKGASFILHESGFFAPIFPVKEQEDKTKDAVYDLNDYSDIFDISDHFANNFFNSGYMNNGKIYTEELVASYKGKYLTLKKVVSKKKVDDKYFIDETKMKKWDTLKGAKKIQRTTKEGFEYTFSEGAIAFPDPLDKPARTMLTSEGTLNRSSHVISDVKTGYLRILTPEECEAINGFDIGWTDTGMPERQRYFIMGNALVVPLVEKMGDRIIEISQ